MSKQNIRNDVKRHDGMIFDFEDRFANIKNDGKINRQT